MEKQDINTDDLVRLIEKIEIDLKALKEIIGYPRGENIDKRISVLMDVAEEGGIVSADKLKKIGRKYGYDPRGLSAFYQGKRASLTRLANDQRGLTEWGQQAVDREKKRREEGI